MQKTWFVIYNLFVLPLLYIGVKFAGLFSAKIREGLRDRQKLFDRLLVDTAKLDRSKKLLWFHSASMGEFEQAKPIIQALKEKYDLNVLITFFSPSGYNNSLSYPYADVVSYLPFDTPSRVKNFLNITRPDLIVLMRYDVWPNLIWQCFKKEIPSMIVDATMASDSKRKWPVVKQFHYSLYIQFNKILTVSDADREGFLEFKVDPDNLVSVGDTRYDRVYQKSINAREMKLFEDGFFEGKKVFVFGSSWESDEEVILPAFFKLAEHDKDVVMIIAPHEPSIIRLEKLEHSFIGKERSIRFSYLKNYSGERIILIDSIGILLTLYYYSDVVYVGGSFKEGIHNVLEPAVYGSPVIFGPKIGGSQEALAMVKVEGGVIVHNKKQAYRVLRTLFLDEAERKRAGERARSFVTTHLGATEKICSHIEEYL
jgi:3-deoxy-D-manno-octulosonic-acid transferase